MPALQYWFSGGALAALLTLLTAAATLGYGWYRAAATEEQAATTKADTTSQRVQRDQVKDLLGKVVSEGNRLHREVKDKEEAQAQQEAEHWAQRTYDLIVAAFGDGEGQLFLDDSGYTFYADSSKNRKIGIWIEGRLRRITELLQRCDRLTVRTQWDASKFN
jgi:hypothetical protein